MIASGMRRTILLGVVLIVVTLAVYWRVGDYEFLNFDDNVYVTENAHVATGLTGSNIVWAFSSVYASNWHPVTWLSHMADAQVYGLNPRGHHLTNVIIHTASTLLLFLLLVRTTGLLWQSSFVAALFALHPLHVESVAWVAERKDLLSAFFWFLTLYLYASYVVKRTPIWYLLALFSFVLGLMSKPMLVTLPAVMLLMDFWPLNRYRIDGKESTRHQLPGKAYSPMSHWKEKIPFFVCSICLAAVTIYAQYRGGAIKSFHAVPLGARLENVVVVYVEYIAKMLWPRDLAVFYPFPSSIPLWQVVGSLVILIVITVATIKAGRRHPCLVVGWFWYLLALTPVIGLIQVGSQSMADRYTYIPLVGLFIMAAWGVPALTQGLRYRHGVLAVLAGAVMLVSSALTWRQLDYWRDNISLFRHALNVTTGNYIAHCNLGIALATKGDLDGAIGHFQKALAIDPSYSDAHYNLGVALATQGDLDAAIREYQAARAINPDHVKVHNNLGIALAAKGNLDAAIKEYQEALTINPNRPDVHNNLGVALATKGDLDAAIREFQEALALNPDFVAAQNNLGTTLEQRGRSDRARK